MESRAPNQAPRTKRGEASTRHVRSRPRRVGSGRVGSSSSSTGASRRRRNTHTHRRRRRVPDQGWVETEVSCKKDVLRRVEGEGGEEPSTIAERRKGRVKVKSRMRPPKQTRTRRLSLN